MATLRKTITTPPSEWIPVKPDEFIGQAGHHAVVLTGKAKRLKASKSGKMKALFYGDPGTGKSSLALCIARLLAGHNLCVEHLNGQKLSVAIVRRWTEESHYYPAIGERYVKVIDEVDQANKDALAELLTFLDVTKTDVICTSNILMLDLLPKRFTSRFQPYQFTPVPKEEIAKLIGRWIPDMPKRAMAIASANEGDVRGALNDAEKVLDMRAAGKPVKEME